MNNDLDFVILWVDGNDKQWLEERAFYENLKGDIANTLYRDWDNLQYIFRAFEVFTPWVRKIHFVTWGHLPQWLNKAHPKLNIVKHMDILEEKDLPVFNSNALEVNMHRIKDLSNTFVLFNDDTFVTAPLKPERFFKNVLPCDQYVVNALSSSSGVGYFVLNNLEVLNRYFSKNKLMKKNFRKVFHPLNGMGNARNIALLPWPRFTGFVDPHQPQPFLKSTFEDVWENEKATLQQTSASKFRTCTDVNQYLFRYWQLAQGNFHPISMRDTKYVTLNMTDLRTGMITEMISSGKYSMICLNDGVSIQTDEDFEEAKVIIQKAFDKILPNKSSFEL